MGLSGKKVLQAKFNPRALFKVDCKLMCCEPFVIDLTSEAVD